MLDEEVGAAVKSGRVVGGQGIYVQMRVHEIAEPSNRADFSLGGTTEISVPGGLVRLEIDVQAPPWAPYDTIEIYRNPTTTATGFNGGVPVFFTANPTHVLTAGTAKAFFDMLTRAQRPLVYAGGGVVNSNSSETLREFAARFDVHDIALVASNLTPDGAVYTTIATFDVVQGV